jgi:hypothetical protein
MTGDEFAAAIVARLESARGIMVRERSGVEAPTAAEAAARRARLAETLGEPLTPPMAARVAYPHRLQLYWQLDQPGARQGAAGEIGFSDVATAILERDLSFLDYAAHPELEYLDTYRILDDHPHMGDGVTTVIALNAAFTDVELFLFADQGLRRLALTFEEYARCLTLTLGYANWQYLFCTDLPARMRAHVRGPYTRRLVRDLERIWPDHGPGELLALARRTG